MYKIKVNGNVYNIYEWEEDTFERDKILIVNCIDIDMLKENFKKSAEWSIYNDDIFIKSYLKYRAVSFSKLESNQIIIDFEEIFNVVEIKHELSIHDLIEEKKDLINHSCTDAIYQGVTFETEYDLEIFNLSSDDQQNISCITNMLEKNIAITSYPYHSKGNEVKMYNRTTLLKLKELMNNKIVLETTFCNLLKLQLSAETDKNIIEGYNYNTELKGAYMEQYNMIINSLTN